MNQRKLGIRCKDAKKNHTPECILRGSVFSFNDINEQYLHHLPPRKPVMYERVSL